MTRVVLSANIPHYHYAAHALYQCGRLERYVTGPVPSGALGRAATALPRHWAAKLAGRRLPDIPLDRVTSLILPELVQKTSAQLRLLSLERSNWLHNELFDASALRFATEGDVFHFVSSVGVRSARRAKQHGAIVVCDERAEEVEFQRAALRPEYRRLGLPFRPPGGTLWIDRVRHEHELADYLFVGSEYAKETYVSTGRDPETIFVCPYGFEPRMFAKTPADCERRFTVVFAGQLTPRKGVHHLVEAWRKAGLRDAALRLVGPIDPVMARLVDTWRREIPGLEVMGGVPKIDLPRIFGAAHVFALPSVADAQPLACFEAMACGLPAIVTTAMGSREVVRDGVDGFVVEPGHSDALAERLCTLHDNRDLAASLGRSARARVDEFTWQRYEARFSAAYDAIVGI